LDPHMSILESMFLSIFVFLFDELLVIVHFIYFKSQIFAYNFSYAWFILIPASKLILAALFIH